MMMQTRSLLAGLEGERAAALPLPFPVVVFVVAIAVAVALEELEPKNPPALLPPQPPSVLLVASSLSAFDSFPAIPPRTSESAFPRESEALTSIGRKPHSRATASAAEVLPTPGGPESKTAFLERSLLAPGPDFGVWTGAPWRWTDSLRRRGGRRELEFWKKRKGLREKKKPRYRKQNH